MSLKELIKSKNFTQAKLVDKLKDMKCYKYQQQISQWITGDKLPDAYSIWCLSKIFEISSDVVLECFFKSAGVG